jgi:nitronate monooxygenase
MAAAKEAMTGLLARLGLEHPIIQAPMAGTSTPALAAAVSNAGGLGSLGLASAGADGARRMMEETKSLTNRSINVNLFCHQTAAPDTAGDARWIEQLKPQFEKFGASPPTELRDIYKSFLIDDAMLEVLLAARAKVVSFHFGLPQTEKIVALKQAGCILFSSATSLDEAQAAEAAGMDAVVAQGFEAGGHRGIFDPARPDDQLSMAVLTEILAAKLSIPVIAAGGIMNGAGVAAALKLGAVAAQLGTAFVGCIESAADTGYRAALGSDAALHTTMTAAISGRPARCLANTFSAIKGDIAAYPRAYDIGKALNAIAKARGDTGYGAQWAGQGAPLARFLPAAALMAALVAELNASLR